jgi:hypothetical protein
MLDSDLPVLRSNFAPWRLQVMTPSSTVPSCKLANACVQLPLIATTELSLLAGRFAFRSLKNKYMLPDQERSGKRKNQKDSFSKNGCIFYASVDMNFAWSRKQK